MQFCRVALGDVWLRLRDVVGHRTEFLGISVFFFLQPTIELDIWSCEFRSIEKVVRGCWTSCTSSLVQVWRSFSLANGAVPGGCQTCSICSVPSQCCSLSFEVHPPRSPPPPELISRTLRDVQWNLCCRDSAVHVSLRKRLQNADRRSKTTECR